MSKLSLDFTTHDHCCDWEFGLTGWLRKMINGKWTTLVQHFSSVQTTQSAWHYSFAFTKSHTHTHTHILMARTAVQGTNTPMGSNSGISILPKDTSTYRPEEPGIKPLIFNQWMIRSTLSHRKERWWQPGCEPLNKGESDKQGNLIV